jgi:hypothetical protein
MLYLRNDISSFAPVADEKVDTKKRKHTKKIST